MQPIVVILPTVWTQQHCPLTWIKEKKKKKKHTIPFTVLPSGQDPCTATSNLLLIWTRHSNTFSCLFSSVSTNLWYDSLEKEKIIGNTLLNLTKCLLFWYFSRMYCCGQGKLKQQKTWLSGSEETQNLKLKRKLLSGFTTHVPPCSLKTKQLHIHREFLALPMTFSDIFIFLIMHSWATGGGGGSVRGFFRQHNLYFW